MALTHHHMKKIYLYSRFERFWHWTQSVLIVLLMVTGLEVHGLFNLFGFERAVDLHNTFGISWLVLFVFIIFWLLTTGEWKQYIPTSKKLFAVARYYAVGIFKGEDHPVHKSSGAKHNPLQRLVYLGLSAILLPLQMVTGLLYWTYNDWVAYGINFVSLETVANVHMGCAYALLAFLIVHIYMTTTGHSITAHVAAMFSGWEEVPVDYKVEEWEVHKKS
ncbi:cytochrome b/b6 domain-containing protein [Desulfovibrio sp. UCD-KL4C]|uniref:cytochrome b/b6 domain-containing protein n=1 Tax=Desulfovibrio sp. UCD-KL4C TaxID=2578120 RepID=UPI0025BFFE35|nr:cytochrome b/b6 domain-containing protein [Desulfovibrio sp. UCD-KL4C]